MKYNLRPLVNMPVYGDFLLFLEERLQELYVRMANQKDQEELRKAQGAIHEINRLKKLKEKVNGS
jgi:hypothetical protein